MPHHSKHNQHQNKQMNGSPASGGASVGCVDSQQQYQNSPLTRNEEYNQAIQSWSSGNIGGTCSTDDILQSRYNHDQYHRVPSSPPDEVGKESHALESESKESLDTLKPNLRDPSQEIASVLLMAAAAVTSEKDLKILGGGVIDSTRDAETFDPRDRRPLKKRKSVDHATGTSVESGDDRTTHGDACHVSPISHSSKSGNAMESNVVGHDTPSTSSAHSYDVKEDCNSSTRGSSRSQTDESMYQVIPQFPSVIHWVLSESSNQHASSELAMNLSVLQWVSHGQAWRIIRWDAFQREVLPAMFPQLVSSKAATGSIDAFLWQLKAWGFQEIKDGPDIGAFAHTVRHQMLSRFFTYDVKLIMCHSYCSFFDADIQKCAKK
jgi:hypothetical protein